VGRRGRAGMPPAWRRRRGRVECFRGNWGR
jgi:hypothetical protein